MSAGVADVNDLSEKYREHVRGFLEKLRAYKFERGASHLEAWINDQVERPALLEISQLFGCGRA